jgi:hypothetical protein
VFGKLHSLLIADTDLPVEIGNNREYITIGAQTIYGAARKNVFRTPQFYLLQI